jgi:hypothetical protein
VPTIMASVTPSLGTAGRFAGKERAAGSRRRESPSCHTFERVLLAHQSGRVINTGQHLLATE